MGREPVQFIAQLETDSNGMPCYWHNMYECECGAAWEDDWSCCCDDECPECGEDISPTDSEWLGPGDGPEDLEDPAQRKYFGVDGHGN